MDSEDICLSVFLCICVGEGMGDKNKLIIPSTFVHRGTDKDFAVISPVDTGISGRR